MNKGDKFKPQPLTGDILIDKDGLTRINNEVIINSDIIN